MFCFPGCVYTWTVIYLLTYIYIINIDIDIERMKNITYITVMLINIALCKDLCILCSITEHIYIDTLYMTHNNSIFYSKSFTFNNRVYSFRHRRYGFINHFRRTIQYCWSKAPTSSANFKSVLTISLLSLFLNLHKVFPCLSVFIFI